MTATYHCVGGPLDGKVYDLPAELDIGTFDHFVDQSQKFFTRQHRYTAVDVYHDLNGQEHCIMRHEDLGIKPTGLAAFDETTPAISTE
jgi:hypothetical protein